MWAARIAAAAVLALVVALCARGAAADQPTGFDHVPHDGKVVVSGRDAIPCAGCHTVDGRGALVGRPGHTACLGACHAARIKPPIAPAALPVCATCHAPSQLAARRPAVEYPPYRRDPDHGLTFDHARHAGSACVACHVEPGAAAKPAATHARCAGCHAAQVAPPMTACAACHPPAFGINARPRLDRGELSVGATFDHVRHRVRSPAAPAMACAQCHGAIASATDIELAAPTTAACAGAGCHDGVAAFATTERCTQCHRGAPGDGFVVHRPDARYDHARHAALPAVGACTSCHTLDAAGEAPAPSHAACARCHAEDFAARQPTICGACHLSTEPWRHLVADQRPAPRSDFGAALSHRVHQATPCARCHRLDTATRELRPPRGHAACSDAACHRAGAGPTPHLDDCLACHAPGREAARAAERLRAPYAVRARFRHAPHRTAGGAEVACTTCHDRVAEADTIDAIAAPRKPACAPCHDGATAWKMSGHGCARCHGR